MTKRPSIVGIDLGTCYSSVAVLDERGYARSVPNSENELCTPSVVYYSEEGPIVGQAAEAAFADDPERVVYHAKRYLGDPDWSCEIDGVEIEPADVLSVILRKLKADAEKHLGTFEKAVITVPAHFSWNQRKLTIAAAERVGLQVIDLVNEPVAAALCYILGEEGLGYLGMVERHTVLVYDLGGGTFDLSLVAFDGENIQVLSANGDLQLGGIDWNQRLIDFVLQEAGRKRGPNRGRFVLKKPRARARLATNVERAKRRLSDLAGDTDGLEIRIAGRGEPISISIDRKGFELLTGDLLDRTRMLIDQLHAQSELGWDEINSVVVVGGASRMPMVRRMIEDKLVKQMAKGIVDPELERAALGEAAVTLKQMGIRKMDAELSVSHGAALYGGLLAERDGLAIDAHQRLAGIKTGQVNPLELGLLARNRRDERIVHTLIEANSPLPATARVTVATRSANQRRASLKIVERGHTDEVCRLVLDDLPPLPAGSKFDVDLQYTPAGLIQVIARHRDSGLLATVNVQHGSGKPNLKSAV